MKHHALLAVVAVLWMALVVAPAVPRAGSASPEPILDAWLERQASIKTWSAEVTQIRELKSLARPLEAGGHVWFVHPNRFRWQLGDPPSTIAVRTQDALFVIYPKLSQAERYALDDSLDASWQHALALLEVGFPRDRDDFYARYEPLTATRAGDAWTLAVRPSAKQARRLIREVRFDVSADEYTLLATELEFPDGSTMRNEFRDHDVNPDLDMTLFEAQLDESYEIVEPLAGRP